MHRALTLALFLSSTAAAADIELAHQGRLLDAIGAPYSGTQTLTLRLLNDSTADTPTAQELHNEVFTDVDIADVYYAVVLGQDSGNSLDGADVSGDVWLEVIVSGTTLGPRSKLTDVPGVAVVSGSGTSGETAAFSCKTLKDSGVTVSGLYWVNPSGDTPVRTWCDMTTDGGGWTLVSHAYSGEVSTGGANNSHRSLRCGGGNFDPRNRGAGSGAIEAVDLAQASTEMAIGIEIDDDMRLGGDLTAYDRAYKFNIPTPSAVTFANHSYYAPNWATVAGPCVPVTLTRIDGGGSYSATQYTLRNSLGTTWTDTYPTGYGVSDNTNCYNHNGDAFVHSIHSGAYRGNTTNECDVHGGRSEYSHRGNYVDDAGAGTTAGTGKTGSSAIWLR
jgi:hypothetical protein